MSALELDCPFCGRPLEALVVPTGGRLEGADASDSRHAVCDCGGEVRWTPGTAGEVRVLSARVPMHPTRWVGDAQ